MSESVLTKAQKVLDANIRVLAGRPTCVECSRLAQVGHHAPHCRVGIIQVLKQEKQEYDELRRFCVEEVRPLIKKLSATPQLIMAKMAELD